ncbi:hypothetical protein [Halobaculum rubrum]|uniref:hypothetical protein n=1 Tax=Halobaculum rubrum TaxID=2872158 RepID=UPI001CA45BEE|nr:hypothetical protein [Halobaculum rubrum]QZX98975.1 hypothetical protein K6T25_11980 [Halobaculum rubrum]
MSTPCTPLPPRRSRWSNTDSIALVPGGVEGDRSPRVAGYYAPFDGYPVTPVDATVPEPTRRDLGIDLTDG